MDKATVNNSHCGAPLDSTVTYLDFAVDVANQSEFLESLVTTLDIFSNEKKSLGLEVFLGSRTRSCSVDICL